jgi:DNA invertase Pin-like site-specific DNA recombinase
MLDKEVLCIARSISRWTARHIDAQGFREWQQGKNKLSVKARQAKAASRNEDIKAYAKDHPEMSNRKIAIMFGVHHQTVNNALKDGE